MKKFAFTAVLTTAFASAAMAQNWPPNVAVINSQKADTVTVTGNLASGKPLDDLSWAASSSNACFPATQNFKFSGNHVFYATTIGPRSVITVSVKPPDSLINLSLYGYMTGNRDFNVVPNLPSCITCEADHKWDRPWKGKVQTSERSIEFRNPTQNTYNIFIGITSPRDAASGIFNLTIKTIH
jgi:hypothetical protein